MPFICAKRIRKKTPIRNVVLTLRLPPGNYTVAWIDPITAAGVKEEKFTHAAGEYKLAAPELRQDLALRLVKE